MARGIIVGRYSNCFATNEFINQNQTDINCLGVIFMKKDGEISESLFSRYMIDGDPNSYKLGELIWYSKNMGVRKAKNANYNKQWLFKIMLIYYKDRMEKIKNMFDFYCQKACLTILKRIIMAVSINNGILIDNTKLDSEENIKILKNDMH